MHLRGCRQAQKQNRQPQQSALGSVNPLPGQGCEPGAPYDYAVGPGFIGIVFGHSDQWEHHGDESGGAAETRSHQKEQAHAGYPDAQHSGHASRDQTIVKRAAGPSGEQIKEWRVVISSMQNGLLQIMKNWNPAEIDGVDFVKPEVLARCPEHDIGKVEKREHSEQDYPKVPRRLHCLSLLTLPCAVHSTGIPGRTPSENRCTCSYHWGAEKWRR